MSRQQKKVQRPRISTHPNDILQLCDAKPTHQAPVHEYLDDPEMAEENKMRVDASEDYHKSTMEIASMKIRETTERRMSVLSKAADVIEKRDLSLKTTMSTSLFSSEISLLGSMGTALKDTLHSMGGIVSVNPKEVAIKMRRNIDKTIEAHEHFQKKFKIDKENVNELMIDSGNSSDAEDSNEDEDEAEDDAPGEKKKFASRLIFVNRIRDILQDTGDMRDALYETDVGKKLLRRHFYPPLSEDAQRLDNFLPLVYSKKTQKEKAVRKIGQKEEKAELVKLADKAQATVLDEEISIGKELDHVSKCLRREIKKMGKKPINYFSFVIDPESFSKTVENVFYVSYLLKDRSVYMSFDENNVPLLNWKKWMDDTSLAKFNDENNCQAIMVFTYEDWKHLIQVLNISEACL